MRIVSWNVNGIRACLGKGFESSLESLQADYICLQETKASPDQVSFDLLSPLSKLPQVWSSAQKKGYSGTAIFTHDPNSKLSESMGVPEYDNEGRLTIAYGKNFNILNFYIPNGAASEERHIFKMNFLDRLIPWLKQFEKKHGPLIICGDYNIAHREIDIHDPVRNQKSSGFLPEERAWMDKFLSAGFIDTFRLVHPEKKDAYSWWSFRQASRERNKGWRIDYICVSESLKKSVKNAEIHPDIMGSDHCPISLELSI
ncbi:MAG: exodeoxyribonuclease III [Oligoflexia bacterium]|nr:exodeoxyribonuclease III [Oligoflexia bacterium]